MCFGWFASVDGGVCGFEVVVFFEIEERVFRCED